MTTTTRRAAQPAATPFALTGIHSDPQTPLNARPMDGGDQLQLFADTPTVVGRTWLAFSLDHDEDDAARRFQQRYGAPPRYITENLGLLLVGPIPSEVQS